jgi:hypothetical protein
LGDVSVKEWVKGFIAIVSIITGIVLIAENAEILGRYNLDGNFVIRVIAGVVLLGGGVTYFWTRSRFYKG